MRARKLFPLAVVLLLLPVTSASGATTIGSTATGSFGNSNCATSICTAVNREAATISPVSGVISRWRLSQGNMATTGHITLRIVAPFGSAPFSMWSGVGTGSSADVPGTAGTYETPTRVPIHAGEALGLEYPSDHAVIGVSSPTGGMSIFNGQLTTQRNQDNGVGAVMPLSADVEPDVDGDGYGDETQDACPTNGALQTPCPPPPPTKKKCKRKHKHSAGAAKKKCKKKKKR
jgi:hypothetical protein